MAVGHPAVTVRGPRRGRSTGAAVAAADAPVPDRIREAASSTSPAASPNWSADETRHARRPGPVGARRPLHRPLYQRPMCGTRRTSGLRCGETSPSFLVAERPLRDVIAVAVPPSFAWHAAYGDLTITPQRYGRPASGVSAQDRRHQRPALIQLVGSLPGSASGRGRGGIIRPRGGGRPRWVRWGRDQCTAAGRVRWSRAWWQLRAPVPVVR